MSWDSYNESIKATGATKGGGIYDKATGAPWTRFGELDGDDNIGKDINECCKASDPCRTPVKVSGIKQMVLRCDETGLHAKKGTDTSVVAACADKCVIIGVGGEGSDPKQINPGICKLADYLKGQGY